MSTEALKEDNKLDRYLSPLHVWALSFGCAVGWGDYIADLPHIEGILAFPTFHLAFDALGDTGLILLGLAAFASILTGLIVNFIVSVLFFLYFMVWSAEEMQQTVSYFKS